MVKILVILVGIANIGVTAYFTQMGWQKVKELPPPPRTIASVDEHGAPAGEHGAAPAAGGHGAAAPAGGHGAPPADAHGAAPAGGHGAPAAATAKTDPKARPWVTLDELYVNVLSNAEESHTVSFKLEVELFDESNRQTMEQRHALIVNTILEVARFQEFEALHTLAGKLYFKEALVGKINETLHYPLVRDMHLASFTLR